MLVDLNQLACIFDIWFEQMLVISNKLDSFISNEKITIKIQIEFMNSKK